jgi:hypothetical protein
MRIDSRPWGYPVLACMALACLAGAAQAKGRPRRPNFSGVWVMDTTKFDNTDARLHGLVFRVVQKSDTMRVTTETSDDGHESTFSATYDLSGLPRQNAMPDGSGTSTATLAWEDATAVLGTRFDVQGRDYTLTQRWTLDAKRRTLTEERTARVGDRQVSQHFVFTKR